MPLPEYIRRVAIFAAIAILFAGGVLLARYIANVLLVVFAGVLFAVVLTTASRWLTDHTFLGPRTAYALVVVLTGALVAGFLWLAGARLSSQVAQLTERLPEVVQQIRSSLQESGWGSLLLTEVQQGQGGGGGGVPGMDALGGISGVFRTMFGAITNLVVVLVLALYLALSPDLYVRGTLHLLPHAYRQRGREVLSAMGTALSRWMMGRLASMLVVGILTAVGLSLAGVPLALVLGLIAAVLSFVPFIGPLLASIPGILVAASQSLHLALMAAVVYGAAQFVESYLITPLIQRRAVYLAPALLIAAQVLMGVLFGILGVFLATPLTVAIVVAVQMLYVESVLGDEVTVLGGGGPD